MILYCFKVKFAKLDIFIASSVKGIVRVGIVWIDRNIDVFDYFKKFFPFETLTVDRLRNLTFIVELKNLLLGKKDVKIRLDVSFSPFQFKVMNAIKRIPFGKTYTYKDVAFMINKPSAYRAVGQALKRNPLPIIFP